MEIAKTQLIQIDWDGPYKLNELHTLENDEIDYGIYQIYGKHQIYGSDVLLYIGKADQVHKHQQMMNGLEKSI